MQLFRKKADNSPKRHLEYIVVIFAMMENGYGKDIETEADIRGAELSAKTGYDYQAGIDVIDRLEKYSHKHITGYPSPAESLKMGAKKSSSASAGGQLRNARFKALIK